MPVERDYFLENAYHNAANNARDEHRPELFSAIRHEKLEFFDSYMGRFVKYAGVGLAIMVAAIYLTCRSCSSDSKNSIQNPPQAVAAEVDKIADTGAPKYFD